MQHTNARKSSTTFPGLLGGRPTNVPILQSGMAVIWKLHVNASSGMHSLPAPNTVHLGPLHHKKAFEKKQCIKQHELKKGIGNVELKFRFARNSNSIAPPAHASKPCHSQHPPKVGLAPRSLCHALSSTNSSWMATMPQFLTVSALLSLSTSETFGAQRLAVVGFPERGFNTDLIIPIRCQLLGRSCSRRHCSRKGLCRRHELGIRLPAKQTTRLAFHVGIGLTRNIWMSC